jgi:hypothetical protein
LQSSESLSALMLARSVVQLHRTLQRSSAMRKHHWQASQPWSSMAVNLTSVAGTALDCGCVTAVVAAASMALMPPLGAPDADTALCEPALTVDFSTCVALDVRR